MPLVSPSDRPPRARFHALTVAAVRRLTDSAVEVTLSVPPGLHEEFGYVGGQYVTLRAEVDGAPVRRSYSLCAEPTPGELRIAIKRDRDGVFSTWANERLAPGARLHVMRPMGDFVPQHRGTSGDRGPSGADAARSRYVAFAAGSGITPVIAIVRGLLAADPGAHVDLVYANRTAADVMFVDDLGALKDRYPSRLAVHHVLSREPRPSPLHTGRLDADRLRAMIGSLLRPATVDEWFLCGPPELVRLIREELHGAGVPGDKVRVELFGAEPA